MDLRAKIGQLIVVRASGYLEDRQRRYPQWEADNATLQRWLGKLHLGGVILLGGSATEVKERSRLLQSWSANPLLIAADIEEGVGQRFSGKTWFPPPMALGAIASFDLSLAKQYAYSMGAVTATEALEIGINWLLAPVVDVNNNHHNPVINVRAFGEDPRTVSALTAAFIAGARTQPIITTAKHFPGHGDTATDSHLDLPTIEHSQSRLETVELLPFQSAIAAGVDSVMTAHLRVATWDDKPATLSPKIMTGILREKLGFDGLIVTDALIMGGIAKYANPETVAVMAISAGVDILLMPDNPEVAIEAIYRGVNEGEIPESRIEESYQRLLRARKTSAPAETTTDSYGVAKKIIKDSLVLAGKLPLDKDKTNEGRNLIVVDDVLNSSYLDLSTPAIAIPQSYGYQRQILDSNSLTLISQDKRPTLLQLFIRGNPFRGSAGLTTDAMTQYESLLQSDSLVGLIVYGSPYVKEWFEARLFSDVPFIFSYGQMDLAQEIAMKNLFSLVSSQEKPANFGF